MDTLQKLRLTNEAIRIYLQAPAGEKSGHSAPVLSLRTLSQQIQETGAVLGCATLEMDHASDIDKELSRYRDNLMRLNQLIQLEKQRLESQRSSTIQRERHVSALRQFIEANRR